MTLSLKNGCTQGSSELAVWLGDSSDSNSEALQANATHATHPLAQYGLAKHIPVHPHEWRKSIVHPDGTYSFLVHDGFLLPEGSFKVKILLTT